MARSQRRWSWPATAMTILAVAGLTGWWWATPPATSAVMAFLAPDWERRAQYASVASLALAVLSLLFVQARKTRQPPTKSPQQRRDELAVDRLAEHLGRQRTLRRMDDPQTRALALRVHPAIDLPDAPGVPTTSPVAALQRWFLRRRRSAGRAGGTQARLDAELPQFVPRRISPAVDDWMRQARRRSGFLLLVGNSSVGKTRLLYESARTVLGDFLVLAPDLGDGDVVNRLADGTFKLPPLLVWLDELQRFLDGPYLTPGSTPITAATVRKLLDALTPVIIVGTLWPEYATDLRASDPAPITNQPQPRYPAALDVLNNCNLTEYPLDTFTPHERQHAASLAAHDPRLAQALADPDYNITEYLAGARELIARYQRATREQRAILHAAVDARRLGIQAPLTRELLCATARGYLTTTHPNNSWFHQALDELTCSTRPTDRATAPLIPIPNLDHTVVLGYTVTDYLHQRLRRERRSTRLSAATWQAFANYPHTHDDLSRLALAAHRRLLYPHAQQLYQHLAETGDREAAFWLDKLLTERGAVEQLRVRADTGDQFAGDGLAELVKRDEMGQLQVRAKAGDQPAADRLAELLAKQGIEDEIYAAVRAMMRKEDPAYPSAALLAERGDVEQLQDRADTGDYTAATELVEFHAMRDDMEQLLVEVEAGNPIAGHIYLRLLERRNADAATRIRHHGLALTTDHVDKVDLLMNSLVTLW